MSVVYTAAGIPVDTDYNTEPCFDCEAYGTGICFGCEFEEVIRRHEDET